MMQKCLEKSKHLQFFLEFFDILQVIISIALWRNRYRVNAEAVLNGYEHVVLPNL